MELFGLLFRISKYKTNFNTFHVPSQCLQTINNEKNYPMSIKFGRPTLTSNEKLMMASMFHSLYAISVQLSPEHKSSGIQKLEVDTFLLQCYQTNTGVKFIVIAEPRQVNFCFCYNQHSSYLLK